ncbi:MAG: homoserine dehydrogenase [Deltaproteobacteria bacterium RIFCSPLOWO2_12_FULL_43_16]|nr:MAG: homoserine dehydrogenase [Deltaproteobacteria bacterium GWA2_43_19]OGQ11331.1 MAG: homoserine dehydrogenase [Deltaproteobacteria bacterium RIFCSPHIGHO2_02_FULL_43_33]OGQ43778.1 MAG: homoserine dehydrogenase [Deltaproteobacteria bacterium RIFCSPLOWO2_01_FULL_42_9]OGQ58965.1 MAG: homoserine dehydrogenase [Deltaproteobacteria bacterium RIFCSPLOWO2_12_FULL_43_16]HBR17313.1 homoserine dehydrogenase [Deltaproteobacteria bacterium]
MQKLNIGLIGFGTVGTGVVKVLKENAKVIQERLGAEIVLKKIADKDTTRDRGVEVDKSVLTMDANDIINDPSINIVIELVGGIEPAKTFIIKALKNKKHVVTANKALLSQHGEEIFKTAQGNGVDIGFEASVGGGIPIIKALKEGLVANKINSIYGIINGTANYILSKMTNEGGKFEDVLKKAQEKGYAEADPTYDVEGIDTAHKLAILINLAYGTYIKLGDIYTEGISKITPLDIKFAKEFGYKIKLLAIAKEEGGEIEARVHATMIPATHLLSTVDGVYNAIHLKGNAVGSVMFYGRGAGMMPTASAVLADVVDICRNINKNAAQRVSPLSYTEEAVRNVEIRHIENLEIPYYLRFSVLDKPGVLSRISGVLGNHNISILSVMQKDRKVGGSVPIVIMTHHAKEKELMAALKEIDKMDVVLDKTVYLRIEENLGGGE